MCGGKLVTICLFWLKVKFLTCLIFFGTRAILLTVCGCESNFPYARQVIRMRSIHLIYFLKMAGNSEFLNEAILEEKLVDVWQEYPYLYDIRSQEFKDRVKREQAVREMTGKLEQKGKIYLL